MASDHEREVIVDCKIDWVSFSVPLPSPTEGRGEGTWEGIQMIVDAVLGGLWQPIAGGHSWQFYEHRGFYHTRVFDEDSKISAFWGNTNAHVHIECGGQACDYIRSAGLWEDFLCKVAARTSRIDFAVDFETDVQPQDFIVNNERKTFKAGGHIFSEEGETCYVGSWKGERFARVYRYHEPHPRAKMLRAEVVMKGDYAKSAMKAVLEDGEKTATLRAHKPFQWLHPLWQPHAAAQSKISATRHDKTASGTLKWLIETVAPALAKASSDGWITPQAFVDTYVTPLLIKNEKGG